MKTIPATFRKNGYDYTLLIREGNVALYEQSREAKTYAYEVVKIRWRGAQNVTFAGSLIHMPATEYLPSDNDWGTYGKTYGLSQTTPLAARKAADDQMRVWVAEEGQKAQKRTPSPAIV